MKAFFLLSVCVFPLISNAERSPDVSGTQRPVSVFSTNGVDPFYPKRKQPEKKAPEIVENPWDKVTLNGVVETAEDKHILLRGAYLGEGETARIKVGNAHFEIRCLQILSDSALIQVQGESRPRWIKLGPSEK